MSLPAAPIGRPRLAAVGAAGAANISIAAVTFLNGLLMARLLGPAGRGAVFVMIAFPTAAAALAGSFVQPVLARRSAAGEQGPRVHGLAVLAALPLALASAAAAALLALGAGQALEPVQRWAVVAYSALWAPVSLATSNLLALDLGAARWRRYHLLRLAVFVAITAGLVVLFALGQADPIAVLAVSLAANVVVGLARLRLAWREGGFALTPWPRVRELYREARAFFASSAGAAALASADQLAAAWVLAPAQAGFYAVAQRSGGLLAPLASAVGLVEFSDAARGGGEQAGRGGRRRRLVMGLTLFALVLAPVVWVAIPALYGAPFAPARAAAVLALVAGLLAALAETREQGLEGAGRAQPVARARWIGATALALVAVPAGLRWGPAGVVAAGIAAHALRGGALALVPVAAGDQGSGAARDPARQA